MFAAFRLFSALSALLLTLGLALPNAFAAYFTADLTARNSTPGKGTHLIVVGAGDEVGGQWLQVAHTQALVFKDRPIHGSIRVIGYIESARTLSILRGWGYTNIRTIESAFLPSAIANEIRSSQLIESIDFLGHNGAEGGFMTDLGTRLDVDSLVHFENLSHKMSQDSFIRIFGCNTGWYLAPALSRTLKVPVAGTFSFADLQRIHESGQWYFQDEGRYPEGAFLTRNEISYSSPMACTQLGGCQRMKPVHISYSGMHGSYAGTVPFLKFFCREVTPQDCVRRMAIAMTYHIGVTPMNAVPTLEQYSANVADFMCPSRLDVAIRLDCRTRVESHLASATGLPTNYSTASGAMLTCGFARCEFERVCLPGRAACELRSAPTRPSTTFYDEVEAYRLGYQALLNGTR